MNIGRVFKKQDDRDDVPCYPVGLCGSCQHQHKDNPVTCDAFPAGIPTTIMLGAYDHHHPYDVEGISDNGITFQPLTNG